MKAVSFHSVAKTFHPSGRPLHALKGVSFDIEEGEFFGLLGPNGAARPR